MTEPTPRASDPWIRPDGIAKATGQARFTADLAFPGLVHAKLLLAGRAHARIVRLDTTRARALGPDATIAELAADPAVPAPTSRPAVFHTTHQ